MVLSLAALLESQALGFVIAAAAICAVSGWLLAHLSARAEGAPRRSKPLWLAGSAVVAGTGVWTTHFIAMLGYRTDYALSYDPFATLVSAGAAVAAVGIPLAVSDLCRKAFWRAALGATAGLGIAAMHIIGMSAIQGCTQTQSAGANVLACLIGMVALGVARGLPVRRHRPALMTALFVVAVCGTHFMSLAGTTVLGETVTGPMSHLQVSLSLLTAGGALMLLVAAGAALVTVRRFEVQGEAHAAALSTALHNMSNGILTLTSDETVRIFNTRLLAMLNLEPEDLVVGMTLETYLGHVGRANGWDPARVGRAVANHRSWIVQDGETRIEHVFDDGRILAIVCQPVPDGAVLTFEDVSKAREAQREIAHLAYHDPLTGLANRRSLGERIAQAFGDGRRFKLLLLDLDRFKFVNDTFGHGVGDQLLQQVAGRLKSVASDTAFVSRLGGDEMALLVFDEANHAEAIGAHVMHLIAEPYCIGDFSVTVGCSIGLCCTDDAADPEHLMQRADLALYEAKRDGRGRLLSYRPGMMEAVTDRNHLETDLRSALARHEFYLVYQPIQSLSTGGIVGFEALIRWVHPTRGLVSPVDFIPLAEDTGLIVPIGGWVLEEACRQAMLWPAHQHVAVNVSAVQFRSPLILAHVATALERSGLPANRLEIELTETALVEEGGQIVQSLQALRALGITIAMDDFGTGFSSLAHLRDLPLDRIKIDRSFVSKAVDDPSSLAVVRAIAQMGLDMGIQTLAEGVETWEQFDTLRSLGCGAAQGFLIGRPARQSGDAADAPSRKAA